MNNKNIIMLVLSTLLMYSVNAQVSKYKTSDFNLQGYPKTVRYMKFEADTNLKQQRTSYIEDYQLTFNENRLLTERVNFINGNRDRVTKFVYNKDRQVEVETIYEANGNIASKTTYTYNTLGRLATLTEVSYPGSKGGANRVEREEIYTYSTKGLLIEQDVHSDNAYQNKVIKYYYGPADSLIATETTYGNNANVDKVTIKRAFNNLAMEKIYSHNERMTRREVYDYNDMLMLSYKEVYNRKNEKILTYKYKYDEHFNLISEKAIDNHGVTTIDYSYEYTKDKFFNWTKRNMYDSWALKYTEVRTIDYYDKTHFYEDIKDYDTKRVITDKEEKATNREREYDTQPVNR